MPAVKPLVYDAALVDCGATAGRRGEDKFCVGEGGAQVGCRGFMCFGSSIGSIGRGRQSGIQESGSKYGCPGTAAMEKNNGLFVRESEGRDNERFWEE